MDNSVLQKLDQFFSQFKFLIYKKGEIMLRPEDDPPGIFYLHKGFARLYSISQDGRELTLNIFKQGSYFPMMWALGNSPNTYFYEAMSNVEVWRAPKDKVVEFLKNEPEVLFELTKRILIGLSGLLSTMEYLLFNSASSKVAFVLLTAAKRFGEKEENGEVMIKLPLTHQNIAHLTGLTRETTSLEMKKLERRGVIGHQKRLLTIKSLKSLEEELASAKYEETLPHTY